MSSDQFPDGDSTQSASPQYRLRQRLLRSLASPLSLPELVDEVGATDARVLWHLRQMASEGLVTSTDGEAAWIRTVTAGDQEEHREATPLARAFPKRVVDDFEDALLESAEGLFGDGLVQAGGEHRSRLSSEQAAEFRDRLLTLIQEYFAPGRGDRTGFKYGFHWVLIPIDLHPLNDPADQAE